MSPNICKNRYVFGLKVLWQIISQRDINICPPSNVGIGIRLPTQIEIETIASKYKSVLKPLELLEEKASTEIRPRLDALENGPEISFRASFNWKLNSLERALTVFKNIVFVRSKLRERG